MEKNKRIAVNSPEIGVYTPVALFSAERVKDAVVGYVEKKVPNVLVRPSAINSWFGSVL